MSQFNAYREWLGISPERLGPDGRPKTHYDLFGLATETTGIEAVQAAAGQLFAEIRRYETSQKPGIHELVVQLRAEIAAAEICLTDPHKRRQYDQEQFGHTFETLQTAPPETEAREAETKETVAEETVVEATVAESKETETKGQQAAVVLEPAPQEAAAKPTVPTSMEVVAAEVVSRKEPRWRSALVRFGRAVVWLFLLPFRSVDRVLAGIAGEGNDILHGFLRVATGAAALLGSTYLGYSLLKPAGPSDSRDATAMTLGASEEDAESGEEGADSEGMTDEEMEFWALWIAMDEEAAKGGEEDVAGMGETSKSGQGMTASQDSLSSASPSSMAPDATKPRWTLGQGPPPPAVVPFDAAQAKEHQEQWAAHLKLPVRFTNAIGMEFVLIPPGEFLMGASNLVFDAQPGERPQHRVRITKPFYLGKCEVTWGQYDSIMRLVLTRLKSSAKNLLGRSVESSLPADTVLWGYADRFCKELTDRPEENGAGRSYRLPTEAEWEFACRAGCGEDVFPGKESGDISDYAWFVGSARSRAQPMQGFRDPFEAFDASRSRSTRGRVQETRANSHTVGLKQPNAFGLHDMYGNVWEMCADWYGEDYYRSSPEADPPGPSSGRFKVTRGGAWNSDPSVAVPRSGLQPFHRGGIEPKGSRDFVGFRVACDVPDRTPSEASPQPSPARASDNPFE